MTLILTLFIFVLGLSLGSFISVVIERIHSNEKGIFFGYSKCPKCHHRLKTTDLIPLLSYIMLKGQCRYCKKTFSSNYFYLELFTAVVLTSLFFLHPFLIEPSIGSITLIPADGIAFIFKSISSLILIGIFFYDLEHLEIPNLFLYSFILFSFVTSLITGTPKLDSIFIGCGIALMFLGGQILISKGKWLGEGDLYLGIGMAALLGWQLLLVALVISYLLGGITASVFLSLKKVDAKSKVPFAPFLVLGTFITLFSGNDILSWYIQYIWG